MLTLQIKRTTTANHPPTTLAQGELSVGLADTPLPSLWVGTSGGPVQLIGFDSANGIVTYGSLVAATGDVKFTVTY
jgi:hypothetical protein